MRKIWVVAMREYSTNVRTKSFLIAIVLVPVLMFGGMGVAIMTKKKGESGTQRIAVIDHSRQLFAALRARAVQRNENNIHDSETGVQRRARFELSEIAPAAEDRDEQLLELSNQVRAGMYFAFVEIGAGVLDDCDDEKDPTCGFGLRYYTNQQTRRDLPRWLSGSANSIVKEMRFAKAGLELDVVEKALRPVSRSDLDLLKRSETGEVQQAQEASKLGNILMPVILLMFMFMGLMMTTQSLLHGVLEEKMQRIAEVLLGSIPPFQLMMGKLLGLMFVVFTLLGIYFTVGTIVADRLDRIGLIEPRVIAWFLGFLVLGIFMYGSMFLAVGSCCNDVKESQSLMMPLMLPMMLPMFMLMPVIQAPNGTLATVMSIIPFWAPMIMVMRLAMPVVVPYWQPPVAIMGCLLTMLFSVWAAGRIFRIGFLLQGKPPKITELMRWAVKG